MKLTHKEYTDPAEKKKDFWRGVALWFGLNIAMGLCYWGAVFLFASAAPSTDPTSSNLYTALMWILGILPWIINIGLFIYFILTRSQIAWGMLAGFGIALALAICLGAIFAAYCFYALGSGGY